MSEQNRRKRNALVISLIAGILFMIVSAILGPIAYAQNGVAGLWGVGATVVVSLAGFIGAFQIFHKRVSLGIGILITAILVMALTLPVVAQGQGIALGVMILVFVAGISTATLPPIWSTRAIIIAFIDCGDHHPLPIYYLPDFGLPTQPELHKFNRQLSYLSFMLVFILRRFSTYSLQIKIILSFILVTIIPLLVLSVINGRSSSAALRDTKHEHN
ncbi:MAG: hypothetical protein MZV64_03895 [Ignavibacteriales bacterium]|nr:hypothetical protein [Ignavibacteriales bacterium]